VASFRELLVAGQGGGQAEEGEEVRTLSFVSDGAAAAAEEAGGRPFDLPAVPTEAFAGLDAGPRDARDEPAQPILPRARREGHPRIAVGALLRPGLTTGSPGGGDTAARGPANVDPGPTPRQRRATDRPDRREPRRSPEQRPPVVTEAIGPFGGVGAARQPRVSRAVSCFFSCSQRDSTLGQRRHPGPSTASMAHTRESYGYICTL
jgi:hypothetical protein